MRRIVWLAAMAALAGCDGLEPLRFELDSQAAWARRSDAERRLRDLADRAARFWGAAGAQDLGGWTIFVRDPPLDGYCLQVNVGGCTSLAGSRIILSASTPVLGAVVHCPENTVLPHELGHAILRTPTHDDPRWALLRAWQLEDAAAFTDCL